MKEGLILNLILMLLSLLSLGVGAWVLAGTRFQGGVDDLFTLLVTLVVALIFALNPLLTFKTAPWRNWMKLSRPKKEETTQPKDAG